MDKKKIGFIIPTYDCGGMPRVLESLSMNLSADKYEQYIMILIKDKEKNYDHQARIIEIEEGGEGFINKSLVFLKRINKVRKLKKELGLDICLSFGVAANIVNILTRAMDRVIITEHNIKSIEHKTWGIYGKVYDFLIKIFYNHADKIISVSEYMKQDLIKNFCVDSTISQTIYNPIDVSKIQKLMKEPLDDLSEEKIFCSPTIINIGSLFYPKGQWYLIRIMPDILKKNPNVKLVFLGEGPDKDKLQELCRRLNIEKNVFFLGLKKNPYKYLFNAKIFVLSSIYEGFPMVILEAMATGRPIVASDCCSGPREILDNNTNYKSTLSTSKESLYGIITPRFSGEILDATSSFQVPEKEMEKAIQLLLANKQKYEYYANKSLERIREFDISQIIINYENTFLKE